ncbi:MAG TPA: hypothetical protein VGK67_10185 [Myxococcales bacterium]|jgi:hypothetical protein
MAATSTAIEMKVEKVFRFQDGRTVFVGVVAPAGVAIQAGRAELWSGDRKLEEFAIEGEMIAEKKAAKDKRSVATRAKVQTPDTQVEAGSCRLRLPS